MMLLKPLIPLLYVFLMLALLFIARSVALNDKDKSQPTSKLRAECQTTKTSISSGDLKIHLHTDNYCYITSGTDMKLHQTFKSAKNFCETIIAPKNFEKSTLILHVPAKINLNVLLLALLGHNRQFWVGGHRNSKGNWVWFDDKPINSKLTPGTGAGGCVFYMKGNLTDLPTNKECNDETFHKKNFICELAPKKCATEPRNNDLPEGVKTFTVNKAIPFTTQDIDCSSPDYASPTSTSRPKLVCQGGKWEYKSNDDRCFKTCGRPTLPTNTLLFTDPKSSQNETENIYRQSTTITFKCQSDGGDRQNHTIECKNGHWEILNGKVKKITDIECHKDSDKPVHPVEDNTVAIIIIVVVLVVVLIVIGAFVALALYCCYGNDKDDDGFDARDYKKSQK